MKQITANLDYIQGHLRYGHIEASLSDKEYKEFEALPKKEQKDWLMDVGSLIVDDYEIDDVGSIYDMVIKDA